MKKIVINGHVVEYNTVAELADIMSVMGMSTQAPTKGKKGTSKKAPKTTQPKAEKPTTRREAIAKWEADKGITDKSKAKYKALTNSNSEFYKNLWATRESDATYEANKKKYGKSFANKEFHKHICALASEESKK